LHDVGETFRFQVFCRGGMDFFQKNDFGHKLTPH
jgi:hypothetical protein